MTRHDVGRRSGTRQRSASPAPAPLGSSGSSRPGVVLAFGLLLTCCVLFLWLVKTSARAGGEPQGQPGAGEARAARRAVPCKVSDLAVTTQPGGLSVTFATDADALCRIVVGYDRADLSFRKTEESWYSRQHLLTVEGLKPGQAYFRVQGRTKDGASFREEVVPFSVPAPARPVAARARPAAAPPAAAAVATSGPAVAAPPDAPTATATVAATRLPPSDVSLEIGRRALDAVRIQLAFGPDALPPEEHRRLAERIRDLYRAWDKRGEHVTAQELMRAYADFRSLRQAYHFSGVVLAANPKDEEALRFQVEYFKRFGMGWKLKETYARLLDVRPDDAALRVACAADTAVYGDYKTLGPADQGELK